MQLLLGDCFDILPTLGENTIDALVTDPPYGWRFMGKAWDGADIERMFEQDVGVDQEPKLYPDGRFRTRKARRAQAAGKYDPSLEASHKFQEWTELWAREAYRVLKPGAHALIFCGPRTYHRMASGVEDAGFEVRDQLQWLFGQGFPKSLNLGQGRGTALKPANEPILLAKKPTSEKTVAANVMRWGTGGLNIDGCRIGSETILTHGSHEGRFPANLILDEDAAEMLDGQTGTLKSGALKRSTGTRRLGFGMKAQDVDYPPTEGGASRFFYIAKSSKRERGQGNNHPTVKPTKLMAYLCRLITPPKGIVLDPFMGSGSTGVAAAKEGFEFVGIEREPPYFEIAKARIFTNTWGGG